MNHTPIANSELILNPDGSIYHLGLKPEELGRIVITVGDPDRVFEVAKHFDSIETEVQRREFKTITGVYKTKRISVVSTGIGTDNIDIVFNELDALVNVDFSTRTPKKQFTRLDFIRIGTSGAIQKDIPIDSLLISSKAIGFDGLLHFYANTSFFEENFSEVFKRKMMWHPKKSSPYVVSADKVLFDSFSDADFIQGVTATNIGFYGPQGRSIRLPVQDEKLNEKLERFVYDGQRITNLEMETSGIYGMSKLLGHRAISLNAILANRALGVFSTQPEKTIEKLILKTLDTIAL